MKEHGACGAIELGGRRELFVDDYLIERVDRARLRLHPPQPREVALVCDVPWEKEGPGYCTVFQDGNLRRLYYRANPGEEGGDTSAALWDTLFMAGRDGRGFHVWPEAFVRPGIQRPGSWFYGQGGCACGMLETPSLFDGAPSELSFYVTDNARVTAPYRLRRYASRLDGFASAYAPLTGGTLLTRPLRVAGNRLEINFSTSAGGRLRVEIQDQSGAPVPGYALDDCDLQYGDQLDRTVSWAAGADVGSLSARPLRVLFELKDADLFGFRFFDTPDANTKEVRT